ncbi:MAG TPA: DNA polymerase III subunit beta [Kiritimatiellia bacterium]|nr:DNA polymerase III subunit beta [Kiritimatiellia bacterium]MBP9572911.1 DNA polymerase III subunit beta [Kiritimatiellia bacterium]HOE36985.1 DNA polymerase III subunit beta [Kiritimatiellia bacterium]HOR74318.1 DNA polymerase III subunit beta [Kiritimatiellia bacterium]HPK69569.1 DNA polymerase III subunit beta [Kiritimatiellia bacterium]
MKIKVKKEAMLASLQKVQSVINPRNTLAVLANVLFRAQDGKLELTATDMALTLRTTMEAEVLQPGSTTIPAKRILGVFRELAVAEVELEVNDQNITLIHAGSSHFKIHGISENEYPNLPELADAKTYTLDQGDFKNMLKLTSFAASLDTNRQLLNGVLLSFKNGKLSVVATDSRRLAHVEQEVEFPADAALDLIVPLKTVDELLKTLGDSGPLKIMATPKQVGFDFNSVFIVSKLEEGKYPNYQQVIPQTSNQRIDLEREVFLSAIRRTSQLVIDVVSGVKLTFSKNQLEILAQAPEVGEARETMAVKYKGPEISISFNPHFLMDPLKVLTDDEVQLHLTDDTSPGVIRSTVNFIYVLMPIRSS